jgi:hypothetical protein
MSWCCPTQPPATGSQSCRMHGRASGSPASLRGGDGLPDNMTIRASGASERMRSAALRPEPSDRYTMMTLGCRSRNIHTADTTDFAAPTLSRSGSRSRAPANRVGKRPVVINDEDSQEPLFLPSRSGHGTARWPPEMGSSASGGHRLAANGFPAGS